MHNANSGLCAELAEDGRSVQQRECAESAPDPEVILINGMPNFRGAAGVARRAVSHIDAMEARWVNR